jgi:hypothetical protein
MTHEPTTAEVELAKPSLARALANTRARLGGQRAALRVRSGDPSTHLVDATAGVGLLVIGGGGRYGASSVRRAAR